MKLKLLALTLLTASLFADSEEVTFERRPLPLEVPELICEEVESEESGWFEKIDAYTDQLEEEITTSLTEEFKDSEDVSEIIKGMETILQRDFASFVDLQPKILFTLLGINDPNDLDGELLTFVEPGIEEMKGRVGQAEQFIDLLTAQFVMFAEKVIDLTDGYPEDDFARDIAAYLEMYTLPDVARSTKDIFFLKDGAISFEKYPEFQLAITDLFKCLLVDTIMDDVLEELDFEGFEDELESYTMNQIRERVLPHLKGSQHPLFSFFSLESLEACITSGSADALEPLRSTYLETDQGKMLLRLEKLNNGFALEISEFEEAFMELVATYMEEKMEQINEITTFLESNFS